MKKCVSYKKIMLLITFEGGWKWEERKKLMLRKYIIEKIMKRKALSYFCYRYIKFILTVLEK